MAQFGGTLNDNLFKSALLVIVAFQLTEAASHASTINNLAAILFIFPYLILSPLAGQLADRANKAKMIQKNKIAEIVLGLLCLAAFWSESIFFLLFVLFLLGAQSAMFGPNKYAILPQLVQGRDLVKGNALIASSTFIGILLGTVLGALLAQTSHSWIWIGVTIVSIAYLGLLAAKKLPQTEVGDPGLKVDWNTFRQSQVLIRLARNNRTIWLTIMGVSWFWFCGIAYITQMPALVRFVGGGDESVVTLLLAVFITGIGLGCIISSWISASKPELGIAPFALFGLTLAGINFAIIPLHMGEALLTADEFLSSGRGIRMTVDLALLGIFGGAFAIPLYTELQYRTRRENRARMIAINNVLNALAMLLSSLLAIFTIGLLDLSITSFLMSIAVLNGFVTLYFLRKLFPETIRLTGFLICRIFYRIESSDMEHIPETGGMLIVCNNVSYIDPVILFGSIRRPVKILINYDIYPQSRLWQSLLRKSDFIDLNRLGNQEGANDTAIDSAVEALEKNMLVIVFPEGKLSEDGSLGIFGNTVTAILERHPTAVHPAGIKGLWGSFFSNGNGPALKSKPRLPWHKISVKLGSPIEPKEAAPERLRDEVGALIANG